MGYFSTNIAGVRLQIDGTDYSDELISLEISDDSLVSSSLITTSGTLELRTIFGGQDIRDLFSQRFSTSKVVTVDIKQPDGTYNRHPRGHLYIEASVFNPQQETTTISLSCGLGFAVSTEDADSTFFEDIIKAQIPQSRLDLLPDDVEYNASLLANLLRVDGEFLYQDKWGYIQKGKIFGSGFRQSPSSIPYRFSSIDTQTCLDLESQTGPVANSFDGREQAPLTVTCSYQVLGEQVQPATNATTKKNFRQFKSLAEHDAYKHQCVKDTTGTTGGRGTQKLQEETLVESPDIVNPLAPYGDGASTYLQTVKTVTEKTYKGQGNQISLEETYVFTNLVNIGDYVTYRIAETQNRPGVTRSHLTSVTSSHTVVKYKYGFGGELEEKETLTYVPAIVWYGAEDYIGSMLRGVVRQLIYEKLATQTNEYYEYDVGYGRYKHDVQTTVRKDYAAQYKGDPWYTIETRKSAGNLAKANQQDRMNIDSSSQSSPQCQACPPGYKCEIKEPSSENREYEVTEGKVQKFSLTGGISLVNSSNENFLSFPIQVRSMRFTGEEKDLKDIVDDYCDLVHKVQNTDKYGFTVQESMRAEFYNYYPSYPFQFFLTAQNRAFSMRSTAASWSVTQTEAVVSFESLLQNEIKTFTVPTLITNSQLQHYLPPADVPTTANYSITNPDSQVANSIRSLTYPGSLTLPASLSPTPTPGPTPPPPAPSPAPTPTPTPPVTGPNPGQGTTPLLSHSNLQFKVPVRNIIKQNTVTAVNPNPPGQGITYQINVTLGVLRINLNYGTIPAPTGTPLNFGTIGVPSSRSVNRGTITNPAP